MKARIDRRRTPNVPRPEHGQRRTDKLAARALARAGERGLFRRAIPLWTAAAIIGALIGYVLLRG